MISLGTRSEQEKRVSEDGKGWTNGVFSLLTSGLKKEVQQDERIRRKKIEVAIAIMDENGRLELTSLSSER